MASPFLPNKPRVSRLVVILLAILPIGITKAASPAGVPAPSSFAYVLQGDAFAKSREAAVQKLAASDRDWFVIDPVFTEEERWSSADLAALHAGRSGRKVVAYISIGE